MITSTNTLEHIPPADISAILGECRRILADDGYLSFQIDYRDHYSYFDPRLSIYHFLRYEEREWRRYSPSLHFQNRLRHHDHLALIEAAGFEVVDEVTTTGDAPALQVLEELPLATPFRGRPLADTAICEGRLLLRKGEHRADDPG